MLVSITFINYKCFHEQTIQFRPSTVVIGRNNAGKSTIVEALRLVSLVANRAEHLRFSPPPSWADLNRHYKGVQPSFDDLEINFESVFHRYSDPPARISALFENGSSVEVFVGLDKGRGHIHGVIKNRKGKVAQNAKEAALASIPKIAILPQVAPVSRNEVILNSEYIKSHLSTSLAPRHFRNQINVLHHYYSDLREIAEETWPGLRIDTFSGHGGKTGDPLRLLVQNEDFVAEISWMGHGLQMWLQTMWFLARSRSSKIVMLDEPDVYMHPDLQRRLIRFLRDRHPQTILTTHSVEMLAEVDPREILIIDRKGAHSAFADTLPAMQLALDELGTVHNIQLSRLWSAKKLLLVEGKDMQFLRRFHDLLAPESLDSFAAIPSISIGGWGGWNYAIGSSMLLQNAGGDSIAAYCILDSDYHTAESINLRLKDATSKHVRLHVWKRKEIENYLVVPAAIARAIAEKSERHPSVEDITRKLAELADFHKDEVQDNFADSFYLENKSRGHKAANIDARMYLGPIWADLDNCLHRISGKTLLSQLSDWSKNVFGVSFGVTTVLRTLRKEDLAPEVVMVITSIMNNDLFSTE